MWEFGVKQPRCFCPDMIGALLMPKQTLMGGCPATNHENMWEFGVKQPRCFCPDMIGALHIWLFSE